MHHQRVGLGRGFVAKFCPRAKVWFLISRHNECCHYSAPYSVPCSTLSVCFSSCSSSHLPDLVLFAELLLLSNIVAFCSAKVATTRVTNLRRQEVNDGRL
jgi:hypothetical protein